MSAIIQTIGLNDKQAENFEQVQKSRGNKVIEISPHQRVIFTGRLSPCFISQSMNSEKQRYKTRECRERLKTKALQKQRLAKIENEKVNILGIGEQ